MRRARLAVLAGIMVVGAIGAIALAPGGGAVTVVNTVTVNKVVTGNVPVGTVFTVRVSCSPVQAGALSITTVNFDAAGNPIGSNVVNAGLTDTCTALETVDGGATTVDYACDTSGTQNDASKVDCSADDTVSFDNVRLDQGTITVTNTFPPAPTTTTAAPTTTTTTTVPVQVKPAFTG
jgi:hypothetical protein